MAAPGVDDVLEGLAKELSCPICLSLMSPPVARLPCCHYFCHECVATSVRHKPACPVCKSKVGRRDIKGDETIDRVVTEFQKLVELKHELVAGNPAAADDAGVSAGGRDAICWLQGKEDRAFDSPSRSMPATALERLRRRADREASPPTVHNQPAASAQAMEDTAAAHQNEGHEHQSPPAVQATDAGEGKEDAACGSGGSGGSHKENAAGASQAVPPGWRGKGPKTAAQQREAQAKKQRQATGTQSIQRWLAKPKASPAEQPEDGAAGPSTAVDAVIPDSAPGVKSADAAAASPASSGAAGDAKAAAMELDDIVAGLDEVGETPPPLQAAAPQTHAVPKPTARADAANAAKPERRARGASAAQGGRKRSSAPEAPEAVDGSGGSARRRIPGRLLPWGCAACTFENKGGEQRCEVCGTAKAEGAAAASGADPTPPQQQPSSNAPVEAEPKGAAAKPPPGCKPAKRQKTAAATTDPAQGAAGWSGGAAKWVLLGSGLDAAGKEQLRQLAAASGSSVVDKWTPRVTHVVAAGAGAAARRTFKVLMALQAGKHIVTEGWAAACLAAGRAVPEAQHEAAKQAAAPSGSSSGGKKGLLQGLEVALAEEFSNEAQVKELLRAAGAKVLPKLPAAGRGGAALVLVDVPETSAAAAEGFRACVVGKPWYARAAGAGVQVLSKRWLAESIVAGRAQPREEFLV